VAGQIKVVNRRRILLGSSRPLRPSEERAIMPLRTHKSSETLTGAPRPAAAGASYRLPHCARRFDESVSPPLPAPLPPLPTRGISIRTIDRFNVGSRSAGSFPLLLSKALTWSIVDRRNRPRHNRPLSRDRPVTGGDRAPSACRRSLPNRGNARCSKKRHALACTPPAPRRGALEPRRLTWTMIGDGPCPRR